jgi:hypothetical protein
LANSKAFFVLSTFLVNPWTPHERGWIPAAFSFSFMASILDLSSVIGRCLP